MDPSRITYTGAIWTILASLAQIIETVFLRIFGQLQAVGRSPYAVTAYTTILDLKSVQ